MTKKKHDSNSKFYKSLGILIISLGLVWGLSSCSIDDIQTVMNQGKNQESDLVDETVEPVEEVEMVEDIVPEPIIEATDMETAEPEPEVMESEEIVAEDEFDGYPQGSYEEDDYGADIDIETLSTEMESCSFKRNSDHLPVTSYIKADLAAFGAYSCVDTEEKVVYLTFDEGYEYGYSASILDTLLANNVQATFFVTGSYIKNNTELVKRMKEEGHLVGNHTMTHPYLTEVSDEEIIEEITSTEELMEELTGYRMDSFLRPPYGAFSERSLYVTRTTGYRTILWSMAYEDWNVDNQPGKEYAYNHVMENYHNGAIILLHAVSESNTEALDDIIKALKAEGYRFGNLYEVE
jgi:peptidoglycan-N-acetylmuramic acid deacetylase